MGVLARQEMDDFKPRHVRLESVTNVFARQSFYQTLYPVFFASLRLCARPYLREALLAKTQRGLSRRRKERQEE